MLKLFSCQYYKCFSLFIHFSQLTTDLYLYRKGPFLSFSQGPHTTLIRPWFSSLVSQCSHLPRWSCHQRRFAKCDWMPAPYTSGQSSYPRRHPTCWASSQRSHIVSSMPCHGAWTCAPLHTHLSIEWECTGFSNRDIYLYPPHNNSSVHLTTTTKVRRIGWIIDGIRVVSERYETPYFQPRHRHPPSQNGPAKNTVGLT